MISAIRTIDGRYFEVGEDSITHILTEVGADGYMWYLIRYGDGRLSQRIPFDDVSLVV